MDTDKNAIYVPNKIVQIKNNSIILINGHCEYPIPVGHIKNNPLGLVKWIHHLMQKRWIKRDHIIQLIEISGVDYYA